VAKATGLDAKALLARSKDLAESNPLLGFRGCRLAIVYPESFDMQARAVFEAACDVAEKGAAPVPEIKIPFVIARKELETLRERVDAIAVEVFAKRGRTIEYLVGTMIELPRAALQAGSIAESADFFSFGTNDLTQTTMGLSRDDAGKFLGAYVDKGMLEHDPFVTIDADGVGEMVRIASERGRKTRAGLKLGICGEHGGDPDSVKFCHKLGLNYVSCSPYRVPVARLAAAQAAIEEKRAAKKK
jgi:pyruvate,orthophosphate dikinase